MAPDEDPPVQRLRLQSALRKARDAASLSQTDVAHTLHWSLSKVIRIENGNTNVSVTDLRAMLELYGITEPQVAERLTRLAIGGRRRRWNAYRDVLKPEYLAYLELESVATHLWQYESLLVPGLLQLPEYATAVMDVFAAPAATPQDRERQLDLQDRQLKVRMLRQERLAGPDAPAVHVVLDEAVLRRWVGKTHDDPSVMRHQITRLKDMVQHGSLDLRVLPFRAGLHPGLQGPFVILAMPGGEGDRVYVEQSRSASALKDSPADIEKFRDTYQLLESLALPADQLTAFLDDVLADMPA